MGKDCGLVDFCSGSPCSVETAQCLNTHGGYICLFCLKGLMLSIHSGKAPATFAKTSQAKFVLKQPKNPIRTEEQLPKFSFAIRTRTTTSQIFKIVRDSNKLFALECSFSLKPPKTKSCLLFDGTIGSCLPKRWLASHFIVVANL